MMKNKIFKVFAVMMMCASLTGCAWWDRFKVDFKSDVNGGLDRVINVYTADGNLIASYKGKIDIETNDGGYVKFDYKGKRYIYYNCFIESVADIN